MRTFLKLLPLLALALVLGAFFGQYQFGPNATQESSPTAQLSEIRLPDVNGEVQNGNQWLGKVVVVNHWATWCPPCVREIPVLLEAQERLKNRGLQIVGIAHDIPEAAKVFGDQIGIDYPSLVVSTGGAELMARQGSPQGSGLPFTAVFSRDGHLAHSKLGELNSKDLNDMVEPLL